MKLNGKTIMVTGANRGIGRAIVEELLKRDVAKVYACSRDKEKLRGLAEKDPRVVPVKLDITSSEDIRSAALHCTDLELLINNAGVATFASLLEGPISVVESDMATNYFGTLNLTREFLQILIGNSRGKGDPTGIANVLSIVSLASMSTLGGYSASKAALFSATQSMRSELHREGVTLYSIFPGPIDTDMIRDVVMDKESPELTAGAIVSGIEEDLTYIFPDPMSREVGGMWERDPKGLIENFSHID